MSVVSLGSATATTTTTPSDTPSPPTTTATPPKNPSTAKKSTAKAKPASTDEKKQQKPERFVLSVEQYKITTSVVNRLVKWLSKEKDVNVKKELKEFWAYQDREMARLGFKAELSFGKHKGKTYQHLWQDDTGRQYLQWMVKQEWCFEDVKQTVKSLAKFFGDKGAPYPIGSKLGKRSAADIASSSGDSKKQKKQK